MFGRRSKTATGDPSLTPTGNERCAQQGCRRRHATRCSYVDKRSRQCPTAWCPDHLVAVAGVAFCRRHASTVTAIEGSEVIAGLPDLDNRAPSLVGWMGHQLDAPIHELFARLAPGSTASLVVDPVTLILTPDGNTRRWAKTWKMVDRVAVLNRVSIDVDEGDDCQVSARVDSELIGRGMPPWIEHRQAGQRVDAATDARERRDFTVAMARSIELVVSGEEVPPRH
ncbi:MAG TPA: hypothetical protein VG520_02115 [Candidatus Dormibacteraeota bacterium]|nr:hypothetical protein [Candidatus Dormibacteraeota bacterium]